MIRALLLLLALAGPALGQAIDAPSAPVPPHRLARLKASGVESVAWVVVPVGVADVEPTADGKGCVVAAPPGTYTVLAAAVAAGKPLFLSATLTFAGEASPQPTPTPTPTPTPGPTPQPTPQPQPAGELERTAAAYARAIPDALDEAAKEIEAGRINDVNAAVDLVARRREAARKAYGDAIDEATRFHFDAGGTFRDRAGYVAVLRRAAAGMRAPR